MDWMATFKRLRHDERGVFAIETAIVAPLLLLMSLGAFQISMLVARQTELQSALADAQAIALASDPDTAAERTVLQNVIMTSTGLPMENVTVQEAYRCGNSTTYMASSASCATGTVMSSFVKIRVTDTFKPAWTSFGLGSAIAFDQTRYVLYKQATKS